MTTIGDFICGVEDLESKGKDILVATVTDKDFGASLDQECKAHYLDVLRELLPGLTCTRAQSGLLLMM